MSEPLGSSPFIHFCYHSFILSKFSKTKKNKKKTKKTKKTNKKQKKPQKTKKEKKKAVKPPLDHIVTNVKLQVLKNKV